MINLWHRGRQGAIEFKWNTVSKLSLTEDWNLTIFVHFVLHRMLYMKTIPQFIRRKVL